MLRHEVYDLIDGERRYQDAFWPQDDSPEFPNPLTVGEFVFLIEHYTAQARATWAQEKKPCGKTLDVIRKIAGIAVNAMEQHGAPARGEF